MYSRHQCALVPRAYEIIIESENIGVCVCVCIRKPNTVDRRKYILFNNVVVLYMLCVHRYTHVIVCNLTGQMNCARASDLCWYNNIYLYIYIRCIIVGSQCVLRCLCVYICISNLCHRRRAPRNNIRPFRTGTRVYYYYTRRTIYNM